MVKGIMPVNSPLSIHYPAPPPGTGDGMSLRRMRQLLRNFGPAAIVASISIGAGESVLAVRVGAWAGYSLMWVVLLAALIKAGLITYLLGRYSVLTGELISTRLAKAPGPRYWCIIFVLVISIFMAPFFISAVAGACGGLLHYLTGFSTPVAWSIAFILISSTFGTLGTFESQVRHQVLVCALLVFATALGAALANPSITAMVKGIFAFGHVPDVPAWALADAEFSARPKLLEIATTFGYIGGSMASYAIYANWTTLNRWGLSGSPDIDAIRKIAGERNRPDYLPDNPGEIARGRAHLVSVKFDVLLGTLVLILVSWAFMTAGAAIMNPSELLPSGYVLLSKQKAIWEQINPVLVPVYYIAVLAALWGTLYAIPEINIRLTHEFSSALFPGILKIPYRTFSLWVGGYLIAGSMTVLLTGITPVRIMDVAAMLSTNIGNTILLAMGLWLNVILPRPYRIGKAVIIASLISICILAFSAYLSMANF